MSNALLDRHTGGAAVGARILVVEDERAVRNVLSRILEEAGHFVVGAATMSEARNALARETFDLLLCDIGMPDGSGLALAREVASELADTAVVMVTAVDDPSVAESAFDLGAYAYLVKPFTRSQVLINVASSLRRRELERARRFHVEELQSKVLDRTFALRQAVKRLEEAETQSHAAEYETIDRLLAALAMSGSESRAHFERVGRYAELLAERARVTTWQTNELRVAAMLHDVGKIGVPDAILTKPGPLTAWEFALVKRHPHTGYRLLAEGTSRILVLAAQVARSHHERWDGNGYPSALAGRDIPLEGRIVAIADAYDSLTSRRVYRPAVFEPDAALAILRSGRGKQFDPQLFDAFAAAIQDVGAIALAHPDPTGPAHPARVLVAERPGMFLDALRTLLSRDDRVQIARVVGTISEAREVAVRDEPDVVIIGSALLADATLDGAPVPGTESPDRAAIVLVDEDDDTEMLRAIQAGCAGCVARGRITAELVPAIVAAHTGETLVHPARLISLLRPLAPAEAVYGSLAHDDATVLQLMASGLSDEAIAERLGLALDTVVGTVNRILIALQARSRLEAVAAAARRGILGMSPTRDDSVETPGDEPEEILGRVPVPLAFVDERTRELIAVNAGFAVLLGSDVSRLQRVDVLSVIGPAERPHVESLISGLASGVLESCHFRGRLLRPDGTELRVQGWIGPARHSGTESLLLAVVPGGDHSLSSRPAPLDPTAGHAVLGTVDHDWRWRDVSSDGAPRLGWDAETLNGVSLLGTVHRDDVPQLLLALARGSVEQHGAVTRVRMQARDGTWVPLHCEVSPLCRHVPPRFALSLRPLAAMDEQEAPPERLSRLEQHLWRIAVETQEAGVYSRPSRSDGWWAHPTVRELSAKQLEVVVRLLQGASTSDIAHGLSLSASTIRNHLAVVYRKFGVHSRTQLLRELAQHGFDQDAPPG